MANISLKQILHPKQVYMENLIRRFAIYTLNPEDVRVTPIHSLFNPDKLLFLSMGLMSRVFKHTDYPLVVKEGRWDLDFELWKGARVPLSANLLEKTLKIFSWSYRPKIEEVLKQYGYFLTFIEYFGYFEDKNSFYHPEIDKIHSAQRHLRNSLLYYKPDVEKYFKFKINPKIDEILLSDSRKHNFVIKEYLLYGKSISKENKGNNTSYVVQDFVDGQVLHDIDNTSQPVEITRQLIVLLYLLLLMDCQTGILPDSRPKYFAIQAYDWLLKTDNIMLTKKQGIKFVDTRGFWIKRGNLFRRGIIIPEMMENLAKGYINFLLDSLP